MIRKSADMIVESDEAGYMLYQGRELQSRQLM